MKTSRSIGDKEKLCETIHYVINLLYLANQVSKEQKKHTEIQTLYIKETVTCAFTVTEMEEHNTSETGLPGPVESKGNSISGLGRTQV